MKIKNNPANVHSNIAAMDFTSSQLAVNVPCAVAEQLYMRAIIAIKIAVAATMNIIFKTKLAIFVALMCRVIDTATRLNIAHRMAAKAKINVKTQCVLSYLMESNIDNNTNEETDMTPKMNATTSAQVRGTPLVRLLGFEMEFALAFAEAEPATFAFR